MHANDDASVDELRRQSEQTRAALSSTVTELRDRVSDTAADLKMRASPDYIKQELRQYVSEKKQGFVDSIQDRVRENPLQAVAVGAAIAYPLLGILRAMPGPLMLIGAGLWLTSKRGQDTTHQMTQRANEAFHDATSQVAGMMGSVQHAAEQRVGQVGDTVSKTVGGMADTVSNTVGGMASSASSRLSGMRDDVASSANAVADQARRGLHDARDVVGQAGRTAYSSVAGAAESVSQTASSAASAVSEAAGSAAESVARTATQAREAVYSAGTQSRDYVLETADRNPLLVAGLGLLAGAAIASLLPKSRVENQAFGGASDAFKHRAQEFASGAAQQGLDQAKGVAAGVVTDLAAAAAREGLNSEGLKKAVEGVTQTVKSVAERGMQSVMGGERADDRAGSSASSQSPSSQSPSSQSPSSQSPSSQPAMGSERNPSSPSKAGSERTGSAQSTPSYKS